MRLLVTRPEPDATRTADTLRAHGHDVTLAPLLTLETLPDTRFGPGPWAGVIVTSTNALRALGGSVAADLARLPVAAVGPRTGEAAMAAGFAQVESAGGDVATLLPLLVERFRDARAPLLYLAGEDRAHDVAGRLAPHGIACTTVAIYRMAAVTELPGQAKAALAAGAIDAVLHYSRRTAETYLAGARAADLTREALAPAHYCLSPAIGSLLQEAGAARVKNATRPDEDSLLALVNEPPGIVP